MGPSAEMRTDFAFTEADTPDVRKRIETDLRAIVEGARANDDHLVALVLTGGFSRGEGTVRDGAPLNDYDLVAVRSRPGGGALYRDIGHALTARVGIEVDVLPVWRARLPLVGRKLFWVDLALGGKVIHGPPDVLARFRRLDAARLPRQEAARLLGNRAAGLLRAVPGAGEPLDPREERLQATKAVLAAMDARLLAEGRYAARLRERLELARDLPDHDAFRAAVEWKLAARETDLADDWWTRARDVLLRAVDDTRAQEARDGITEHAFHLVQGRRWRASPSRALRVATWDMLRVTSFPDGPADAEAARAALARFGRVESSAWPRLKESLFRMRATTLQ
jgi:hypothetical protein